MTSAPGERNIGAILDFFDISSQTAQASGATCLQDKYVALKFNIGSHVFLVTKTKKGNLLMKALIIPALTMPLCLLAACQQTGPKAPVASEVCEGVNAMIGQEISTKYDISIARSVALKISAAAEADVAKLKGLKEAKIDASTEAKLGSEIKAIVETKSKVTTDFFQQDQSFAQAACFIDSILSRSDISKSDREFFEAQRRALSANRVAYLDVLTGLKKN